MSTALRTFFLLVVITAGSLSLKAQTPFELKYISSYFTDVFDQGAAEIVAYDASSFKLFFTNADANTVSVLDISDPTSPVLIDTIEMDLYGGGVNSVAVHNGMVAVAVEADPVTAPGKVVIFNTDGVFQKEFTVGALPDMLTFTPDGAMILTANEGEPNSQYSEDPEGSVSVIDLATDQVVTLSFAAYNDKFAHLTNKGVRIFGPGAAVGQDLEPEYIAVTPDGHTAYVALQENNALAVVDLSVPAIVDILPLGVKDHSGGRPVLTEYVLNDLIDLPELGAPVYDGGQPTVKLGGFSGLFFDAAHSTADEYIFYTIPDRGPNDDAVSKSRVVGTGNEPAPANLRPFKLPDYTASMVKLRMNPNSGTIVLDELIQLGRVQNNDTVPITGKGNVFGFDEIPVTYQDEATPYRAEDWVDTISGEVYTELPPDPFGGDFEGILRDRDGNFWMCDEYRPGLYKFDANGIMIDRFVPEGTSALNVIIDLGPGTYGNETLPAVYTRRWANRGFEAIAYDEEQHVIYAFIQSPMYNPNSTTKDNSDVIRILGVDAETGTPVSEYIYLLERNREAGFSPSRVDKIGDAVYVGDGKFLVIERDSGLPADGATSQKYIFEIDLTLATDLLADTTLAQLSAKTVSDGPADKTLEMMTADELAAAGIRVAHKRKVLNLPSIGYLPSDKVEGLALLPGGALAVLNDNDFGLAGAGVTDNSVLGIIQFLNDYGMDASDRDNGINIANHPTLGLFQPDALAAFEIDGATYLITANEGDARDYDGFSEETRVEDLVLDPFAFPHADSLQRLENMGRLRTTEATGDLDGDGDFDRVYSYGARSFSILDRFGNLVYDSGDALESIIANDPNFAPYFNSNHDENQSTDSRSDDKGPEPEAVEVAEWNGMLLAFIGLERVGGIMVFDISDPRQPVFLTYANSRDFTVEDVQSRAALDLGPEDIIFIGAADSPVDQPLIVVANEVSGTVSIYSTDEIVDTDDPFRQPVAWKVFPNPATEVIFSNRTSNYQVLDLSGRLLRLVTNSNRIDLRDLPAGAYLVRDAKTDQSQKVIKADRR